jgi:hypothetical protein
MVIVACSEIHKDPHSTGSSAFSPINGTSESKLVHVKRNSGSRHPFTHNKVAFELGEHVHVCVK